MTINAWAKKWNIPAEALNDLRRELCAENDRVYMPPQSNIFTEAGALNSVRLEASEKGLRLWRNNRGAGKDEYGNYIRWGLANESKAVNEVIKSSDLIGIRPITLLNGAIIGQFVAREMKRPGWKFTGTKEENAQLNFLRLIAALGGDAQFSTGRGSL
ncbi:MAG: hypothetical protein PHN88_14720 [Ignavibacteria bacterium]|nr:hypothetical protein [Ignavibacteria bacterium]